MTKLITAHELARQLLAMEDLPFESRLKLLEDELLLTTEEELLDELESYEITVDYNTCPDCNTYTEDGSWCYSCLIDYDYDEDAHAESRRRWIAENNEY